MAESESQILSASSLIMSSANNSIPPLGLTSKLEMCLSTIKRLNSKSGTLLAKKDSGVFQPITTKEQMLHSLSMISPIDNPLKIFPFG